MHCQMPDFQYNTQPCGEKANDYLIITFKDDSDKEVKYRVNFCDSHYYAILRMSEIGMYHLWKAGKLYGGFIDG